MHFVKAGVPNKYIGNCALMSVLLCLKKARQSHHQRASKRSGSVGNRGELAPLNQARGAQSTKSNLGGPELCKAQNRSKHKIVQNTKLCKACVQYPNTCCVQIGALSIVYFFFF